MPGSTKVILDKIGVAIGIITVQQSAQRSRGWEGPKWRKTGRAYLVYETLKINRLGIVLQVTTLDGVKTIPIKFPEPLESQDQIRPALINLLTDARKSLDPANQSPHQETSE